MALRTITIGTPGNKTSADSLHAALSKISSNFVDLDTLLSGLASTVSPNLTGTTTAQALNITSGLDAVLTLESTLAPTTTFRRKQIFSTVNIGGGSDWLFRMIRPSDGAVVDFNLQSSAPGTIFTTGNFNPATKLDVAGGSIAESGILQFGSKTRQMINLWGAQYGIGVQGNTAYIRTATEFAVHWGGTHSDVQGDPGAGGTNLLRIRGDGFTYKGNTIYHSGNLTPVLTTAANNFTARQVFNNGSVSGSVNTVNTDYSIKSRIDSGFWQSSTTSAALGWPVGSSSWFHLIASTHTNDANYFSMQIASDFYTNTDFFIRNTANDGARNWNKLWHSNNFNPGLYLQRNINETTAAPGPNFQMITQEPDRNSMGDLGTPNGVVAAADRFYLPNVFIHTAVNPIGHREQFHTEMRSQGAQTGRFVVGWNMGSQIVNGSGNAFAMNGVTQIEPAASAEVEASVSELNMICKRDVVRKTILQLVDCAGSGGRGTVIDAALLISKQNGAFGNGVGIQFGAQGDANQWPVRSRLLLCDVGTVEAGIDVRNASFSSSQALLLSPGHQITWALGSGGAIRSDTGRNSVAQVFFDGGIAWQGSDGKGFRFSLGTSSLHPEADSNASLGQPTLRWNTLFASTGSIQTSDGTLKKSYGPPDDRLLDAIGAINVVLFKYLSSIEEKGEAEARLHSGVIAQQVAQALQCIGLDPAAYSFWCEDPVFEEVDVRVTTTEQIVNYVPYTEYDYVLQDDGTAVFKMVHKTRPEPVLEDILVFNEDGTVHITPGTPARTSLDENGNTIVITPASPEKQTTISRPKTQVVTKIVKEQRPKLDANGNPVTILGIRYTDLLMLLHAWSRREIDLLKATLIDKQ